MGADGSVKISSEEIDERSVSKAMGRKGKTNINLFYVLENLDSPVCLVRNINIILVVYEDA